MNRTALIFGATGKLFHGYPLLDTKQFIAGAVGKQVLKDVLQNGTYQKVISVGRRNVELDDSVPQDKLVI